MMRTVIKNFRQAFLLLALMLPASSVLALEVGDMAPDFELAASDEKTYRLSDFRDESAVVIAWFPKAFTSGCTIECKSLAQNGSKLKKFNMQYFMASVDPLVENMRFAESQEADFPLLSDEDKSVAAAYGVLSERGFAMRHTFYIGVDGKILAIDRNVQPSSSAEDMIATLKKLGVAMRSMPTKNTANTFKLDEGQAPPAASLQDIAWLVGNWQGEAFGDKFEEVWNAASNGTMVGMFKVLNGDGIAFYELMLLVEEQGSLSLKVKHFNADFSAWETKKEFVKFDLVAVEKDAVHFEGLSFRRLDHNTLISFLAMGKAEKMREVQLDYSRRQDPLSQQ